MFSLSVFKDTNTPSPFVEHLHVPNDDGSAAKYGKPDHLYLDAMGFGMGSNCLQVGMGMGPLQNEVLEIKPIIFNNFHLLFLVSLYAGDVSSM